MLPGIGRTLICCLIITGRASATPSEKDAIKWRNKEIVRYAKSAEIHNYLNESVDPCEDFYNFVCGNYERINPPSARSQIGFFVTLSQSFDRKVTTLLQQNNEMATATDKKVMQFYESCLNVPALETTYGAKLKEIISEFGQMPLLGGDKWQESEFDWLKTVAEIAHKYGIRIIVGYVNQIDDANNTLNRMNILLQDMPLKSQSIYTDNGHGFIRNAFRSLIAKELKNFLGIDENLAMLTAKEIFEFETNLFAGYNRTSDNCSEADSTTLGNLTTIEEMQSKYLQYLPDLDIKRLINISMGSVPRQLVYNRIEDKVDNLATTLKETPKRTVANYIFYYLLHEFMLTAPNDKKVLRDLCIQTTKSHFSKVMENMVYRKHTTPKMVQDVHYMFRTIKSAFHNVLQSDKLFWMREDTRRYALEKLKTFRMEINSYEHNNFTEEFGLLRINNRDYLENLKSIYALNALKSRAKLNQPAKSDDDYDDPVQLSYTPFYIQNENLIKIPVSFVQPYYFLSDSYPNALQFGTLGFLMSHEMIHGFDEEGRTYDKLGNKHEWWDTVSNEYFNNQTECFRDQYRKYIYDGQSLPKLSTQSENIADNGGIRLAYGAYLQWYEDAVRTYQNMDLESMPRLNYNNKQLFFISYGQMWCSFIQPLVRYYAASIDDHVPNKFRVIGPLSNLEEFSEEFNCARGCGMNPTEKCIIY